MLKDWACFPLQAQRYAGVGFEFLLRHDGAGDGQLKEKFRARWHCPMSILGTASRSGVISLKVKAAVIQVSRLQGLLSPVLCLVLI